MDTDAARKKRPWGKILLFTSLALNLAVAGLVAGAIFSGGRDRDRSPLLRDLGFGPFVSALPDRDKAALGDALKQQAGTFLENRRKVRADMEEILDALRMDPFDADGFRALIARQSDRIQERQKLGADALIARIAEMTPGERAEYADALRNALRRHKPRKK